MSNIRTILNQLKKDNINGYDYMEYESNANGWDRTWIINKFNSNYTNGEITFYYDNNKYCFSGIIPLDDFMNMSNTEIIQWLGAYSYYNTIEKEEGLN